MYGAIWGIAFLFAFVVIENFIKGGCKKKITPWDVKKELTYEKLALF